MSLPEFDFFDSLWEDSDELYSSEEPIHAFGGLKSLLTSMGYHIQKAEGYKAIDVADVTMEEISSGAIEFTNEGIFVTTEGVRRKIFLYKRDYHLELYGKPRAHIRKCDVIDRFSNGKSIPLYRRANTDSVWVHDMDDNYIDKQVSGLQICSHCIQMAQEAYPSMTVADFIELLKNADEAVPETDVEVDIFGYTKDWETISRETREKHKYTCECCGLKIEDPYDQHYIHVHHKNGRKIDNRESNLQCLCLRCHANVDQTHHDNLLGTKVKQIEYSDFESKYPALKYPPINSTTTTVYRQSLLDEEQYAEGEYKVPYSKNDTDSDLPF